MRALHWYFAYGSNMTRARLEARVGRCEVGGTAWIRGFDLRFHKRGRDGSGKCDAFRTDDAAHVLHGVVFGLRADQRSALDGYEGPDYAVSTLDVVHRDGALEAFLYVARPRAIDHGLTPYDWYKAFVAEGARAAGLPEAYRTRIESHPARADPDASRARRNEAILAPLRDLGRPAGLAQARDAENS